MIPSQALPVADHFRDDGAGAHEQRGVLRLRARLLFGQGPNTDPPFRPLPLGAGRPQRPLRRPLGAPRAPQRVKAAQLGLHAGRGAARCGAGGGSGVGRQHLEEDARAGRHLNLKSIKVKTTDV